MCERVVAWVETNQHKAASDRLPKAILFFRDGVSESQFGMVRHEELRQIQEGCSDAEALLRKGKKALLTPAVKKWAPKITLIVVVKRHHARFYPTEPVTNADKINKQFAHNLPCGTVADTVVVTPTQWSFYLQSHHSGLGTARSALYVVLEDTAEYKPRELQMVVSYLPPDSFLVQSRANINADKQPMLHRLQGHENHLSLRSGSVRRLAVRETSMLSSAIHRQALPA